MSQKSIDLVGQIKTLINEEDLLAYYDFHFLLPGGRDITGLCKISAQERRGMRLEGLTVLFILDLPDKTAQREVDDHFTHAPWDSLVDRLPGLKVAVPMPLMVLSATGVIKQVDLAVHLDYYTEAYVTDKLFPLVNQTAGLSPGELSFWKETGPAPGAGGPVPEPPTHEGGSLVHWLKGLFGRRVD